MLVSMAPALTELNDAEDQSQWWMPVVKHLGLKEMWADVGIADEDWGAYAGAVKR